MVYLAQVFYWKTCANQMTLKLTARSSGTNTVHTYVRAEKVNYVTFTSSRHILLSESVLCPQKFELWDGTSLHGFSGLRSFGFHTNLGGNKWLCESYFKFTLYSFRVYIIPTKIWILDGASLVFLVCLASFRTWTGVGIVDYVGHISFLRFVLL